MINCRILLSVAASLLALSGCGTDDGEWDTDPAVSAPTVTFKTVTPAGDTVNLTAPDGTRVELRFPAGAVGAPLLVTLTATSPASGEKLHLDLAPAGTRFALPLELAISLAGGAAPGPATGAIYQGTPVPFVVGTDGVLRIAIPAFLGAPLGLTRAKVDSDQDGTFTVEEQVDMVFFVESVRARLNNLQDNAEFDEALEANLAIAALVQRSSLDGFAEEAEPFLEGALSDSCNLYSAAIAAAETLTITEYDDFVNAFKEVLYWQSVLDKLGGRDQCDSPVSFVEIMQDEIQEQIAFYADHRDQLVDTASQDFSDLGDQAQSVDRLEDEATTLDVPEFAGLLEDQLIPGVYDELLRGPNRDCRDRNDYRALIDLMRSADSQPAQQARIAAAAQYCATRVTSEFRDTAGVLKASGEALGVSGDSPPVKSASISVGETGSLKLSGPIRALACPDGQVELEELVFELAGTEVARLGVAPFLATPLSLDLATLIQRANITPGNSQQPLTLKRESNACDGFWGSNPEPLLTLNLNFGPIVVVSTVPASEALRPGDARKFRAKDSGGTEVPVTWGATGGSITPEGLYTAAAVPGNFVVTAIRIGNQQQRANANVSILGRALLHATLGHVGQHGGGTIVRHEESEDSQTHDVPAGATAGYWGNPNSLAFGEDVIYRSPRFEPNNPNPPPPEVIDTGGTSISSSEGECITIKFSFTPGSNYFERTTAPGRFTANIDAFGDITGGNLTCGNGDFGMSFSTGFTLTRIRPDPDPPEDDD